MPLMDRLNQDASTTQHERVVALPWRRVRDRGYAHLSRLNQLVEHPGHAADECLSRFSVNNGMEFDYFGAAHRAASQAGNQMPAMVLAPHDGHPELAS